MTDESATGPGERRSFTDVASLFQPIVPVDGRRPPPEPGAGAHPGADEARTDWPPPLDPAGTGPLLQVPPQGRPSMAPSDTDDVPPRPARRRRPWRLGLVAVAGVAAAAAFWYANPTQLRRFVAHRSAPEASAPAPPVPAPAPPRPAPTAVVTPAPAPAPPVVAPPVPAPAPAAPVESAPPAASNAGATPEAAPAEPPPPAPAPQAAAPAAPVPEAQPASPNPAPAAAPARPFGHVTIRYRWGLASGETLARQVADSVSGQADRVDVRGAPRNYRIHTVVFYHPEDRDLAETLAQRTAPPGKPWTVRLDQPRQPAGSFEVWIH